MQDPFQTPQAQLDPQLDRPNNPQFEEPRTLVLLALKVGIGLDLLSTPFVFMGEDESMDLAVGGIFLLILITMIFTWVTWSMWIHRAAKNASTVASLSFAPGWAVGWHFVPFANLVKPFQIVKEISELTLPEGKQLQLNTMQVWWGLWLASNFVANISFRMNLTGTAAMVVSLLETATGVLAAVWAIKIVTGINDGQRAR